MNTLLIEWLLASPEARLEIEFEAIWDIYPKRVRKGAAVKAYIATRRKGASFSVLLDATKGYKQDRKGEEAKFTEHAATFFGAEAGWKDHSGKANGHASVRSCSTPEPRSYMTPMLYSAWGLPTFAKARYSRSAVS